MTEVKEKAELHCRSFAAAMALQETNPSATTTDIAEAMFLHYQNNNFTAFSLGTKRELGTRNEVVPAMAQYFDIWVNRGLGLNVRMETYRVQEFSPSAALCFLTWRYLPPPNSQQESWAWESLYIFRLTPEGKTGYWELCVTDNELTSILQRFPDFYDPLRY